MLTYLYALFAADAVGRGLDIYVLVDTKSKHIDFPEHQFGASIVALPAGFALVRIHGYMVCLELFHTLQIGSLLDNPCKKLAHQLSNLRVVTLKSKVTAGNEMYLSIGQVAFEGIGSSWNE